jgi:hypothetical protein
MVLSLWDAPDSVHPRTATGIVGTDEWAAGTIARRGAAAAHDHAVSISLILNSEFSKKLP